MRTYNKYIYIVSITIILFLILFINLQSVFKYANEKDLKGYYISIKEPVFNFEKWCDASYQSDEETYLTEHVGFRNSMVRLHNQIDFSIFKKSNIQDAFVGNENYLFTISEMYDINGGYNRYPNDLESRFKQLKKLDTYLTKRGIPLIIVISPGKAYYYKKYIPQKFLSNDPVTCYKSFVSYAQNNQLKLVDLNHWFSIIADTCSYPLYPKTGIHWSRYGSIIGLDSILKSVTTFSHKSMPKIKIRKIESSNIPDEYDGDIMESSNLLFPISTTTLGYPELTYDTTSGKPNLLYISDSFFNNIYYNGIFEKISNFKSDFWYYSREGHKYNNFSFNVSDIDLLNSLEGRDAVIMMFCPANLYEQFWTFPNMFTERINAHEKN